MSAPVQPVVLRFFGKPEKTERGFEIINFDDANGNGCTLQQSSAIDDSPRGYDRPGTSFVWLGRGDERMHLHREHVSELVTVLQKWLASGGLNT